MRAREFVTESKTFASDRAKLSADIEYPMHDAYVLPGLRNNDAYKSYRLGIAIARARADAGGAGKDLPPWHAQGALGPNAVIVGFNNGIEPIIDHALAMTDIPGGKKLVGTQASQEPPGVDTQSPVRAFKGYPR
jgi:hypothetical protein